MTCPGSFDLEAALQETPEDRALVHRVAAAIMAEPHRAVEIMRAAYPSPATEIDRLRVENARLRGALHLAQPFINGRGLTFVEQKVAAALADGGVS